MATEGDVMTAPERIRGFTLVESALAATILALLAALSVPAMAALLERQRASAAMGTLSTQMQLARMAAITYRRPTVLCPSVDGLTCQGGTDWGRGWMLFLDRDGNHRPDASDEILRVESPPSRPTLRLVGTAGRPRVRYLADGRSAGSTITISVCNMKGDLLGAVIVNNMGRPRSFRPTSPAPCPG